MNRITLSALIAAAIICSLAVPGFAQTNVYEPNWESLDSRPNPSWFVDAKFGIFIHWGVYSVPSFAPKDQYSEWYWEALDNDPANQNEKRRRRGLATKAFHNRVYGEDFEYTDFAPLFKAELYDPDEWAEIFADSGAKYVVLTSKHHDGFTLWPNEDANRTWGRYWNSADAGPKRDLLGELTESVRAKGMKMGIYYSLYEWFNPLWLNDKPRYVEEHMFPQFKDVVTRYKPAVIFSDGEWDMTYKEWKSPELLAWLFNEAPNKDEVVVNDRWGKTTRHEHGGYFTTEYGAGMKDASHPWEENRGIGYSFGLNRFEPLSNYRTGEELVWILADLVSRGGNLLLDVGPTADGRIPVIMQDRLAEIGAWLRVNGEGIYETTSWRISQQWTEGERPEQKFGHYMEKYDIMTLAGQQPREGRAVKQVFFTKKGDTLYAITPGWPKGELVLKDVKPARGAKVTLLGHDQPLKWKQAGANIVITVPNLTVDEVPCKHAYTFKVTGVE
jgi:alpha-L-fucosidase